MRTISIVLFNILIQLFFNCLYAAEINDIHFYHIGLRDGLSHSTVFSINQDQEGYMWFATYDGVNRYDGYNFKIYRHQQGDNQTIACNRSSCIAIDLQDRVWIGTSKSLSLYDRDKDCFVNYFYNQQKKRSTSVNAIVPINKDCLLISTVEGLAFFDIQKGKFTTETLPSAMTLWRNACIVKRGEYIYIGANNALYTYSLLTKKLEKLTDMPKATKIQAIEFSPVSDVIWLATEGEGLFSYSPKTGHIQNYRSENNELSSNFVRTLAIDEEYNLWIGTYLGLHIYKNNTGNFHLMKSSPIQEGNISQNSVRCIFKDSQNGMWLGTYWGGLNYYHPLCNRFKHIKRIHTQNSLSNNLVSCIVEDYDGSAWIGTTDGGLNHYDVKNDKYKNYISSTIDENSRQPFRDIKTIYISKENEKVYVGAHASGMMIINKRTGYINYLNKKNNQLPTDNIYSIIPDKDKNGLWIAALNYLLHYDCRTHKTIIIQHLKGYKAQNNYRTLFRDSRDNIWIGGERGLLLYKEMDQNLVMNQEFKFTEGLDQASINCIYETSTGQILVGTNIGLFSLSVNSGECIKLNRMNGLPSDVICGILEDIHGRLWISSNLGLTCMLPDYKIIRNFTTIDGLQSNQFNPGSYCRTSSGVMYFGGINGITAFDPERMIDNSFAPQPVINKLQVFNKEVLPGDETGILPKSIEKLRSITLKPSQNSFTLSFVVMNYIARQHNTYSYKLEGFDENWYEQTYISPITYSNLPAGNYTFMIKAANNDGIWNNEPTTLRIKVLPVWYKTHWALLLYLLSFSLLIAGIIRFFWLRKSMKAQLDMERLDKERNEEISQTKIRFYINISHELRTPLTLIAAPLQELLTRVNNHWEREQLIYIQRNTNRLLHLVNQLMDYRRAELGVFKLQPQYSNAYKRILNSFINYENLSKKRDINFNFSSDLEDKEFLFDENYLDLIVNNLLSNAFKYTEKGSITLKLFEENNELVLQVADTGVGISAEKQKHIFERFYQVDQDKEGSGIGLSLVERLISLHHGRIVLESEPGKGSTFTVYIPQDESLYSKEELEAREIPTDDRLMYSTNANDLFIDDNVNNETEEEPVPDEKAERILIVEDNKELRQYLVNGLSPYFNVIEVENGQEAIDFLKNNEINLDLILTDVMMPVMDGIKLCKMLKQNIRTCHIPVYMLSAKTDVKYQLEGIQAGAEDYISKPFSMAILRAKIQNTLKTRSRAFEHYSDAIEIEPEKIANNSMDEDLLKKAIEVVEKNIDNIEFSTEQFAKEMNMSRSNLHLKLKAITGKSAIDFIHKIRFNRACQLLKEGKYTISEISFMVGYNTPSYFTARFKKFMGCLPTEYLKKQ